MLELVKYGDINKQRLARVWIELNEGYGEAFVSSIKRTRNKGYATKLCIELFKQYKLKYTYLPLFIYIKPTNIPSLNLACKLKAKAQKVIMHNGKPLIEFKL